MTTLIDKTGTQYDLIDLGNEKVKLQSKSYPEDSYGTYRKEFIESAIETGVLIEVEVSSE